MSEIKNIKGYSTLPETQKRKFQQQFHDDDINYLASYAIETGGINDIDIEKLNAKIDSKTAHSFFNLNSFYVLLSGIFIGLSVFFVITEKSRTHAAHFENITEDAVLNSNAPIVMPQGSINTDNVFPKEHFSIQNAGEQIANTTEVYENMESKTISEVNLSKPEVREEANFVYIPNAPVIYIADLKVANYKVYYFQNEQNILLNDEGIAAKYAERNEVENASLSKTGDINYYAHQIIKDAMEAFKIKDNTTCIELLKLLYARNKTDVNTQFYLGMSYFYSSNFNLAERYFSEVLNNSVNVFQQEAEFYKAQSLLNTDRNEEAKVLLRSIAERKLFYSERAAELLKVN